METSGRELPIVLEESIEHIYDVKWMKAAKPEDDSQHVTNRLDLEESLGSWPKTLYVQKLTSRVCPTPLYILLFQKPPQNKEKEKKRRLLWGY